MDATQVIETVVERPIDLTPLEVSAIRQGAAQLRRIVRLPNGTGGAHHYYRKFPAEWHDQFRVVSPARLSGWIFWSGNLATSLTPETQTQYDAFTLKVYDHGILCPFGRPGDRLWGRETWVALWPDLDEVPIEECTIEYRADGDPSRFPGQWPPETRDDPERPRWQRPRAMPRSASRLLLEIEDVRPVKLHTLTDEDAGREGFAGLDDMRAEWDRQHAGPRVKLSAAHVPWSADPWVWVLRFKALCGLSPSVKPFV